LRIENLVTTEPNGLISAFSDYNEPHDHLCALEAPVRTVPPPPNLASQAPSSTTSTGASKNSGVSV
jgi:hypothetical protein